MISDMGEYRQRRDTRRWGGEGLGADSDQAHLWEEVTFET